MSLHELPRGYDAWKTDPGPAYDGLTSRQEDASADIELLEGFAEKIRALVAAELVKLNADLRIAGLDQRDREGAEGYIHDLVTNLPDYIASGRTMRDATAVLNGEDE